MSPEPEPSELDTAPSPACVEPHHLGLRAGIGLSERSGSIGARGLPDAENNEDV
jgi:hypothetical protein